MKNSDINKVEGVGAGTTMRGERRSRDCEEKCKVERTERKECVSRESGSQDVRGCAAMNGMEETG